MCISTYTYTYTRIYTLQTSAQEMEIYKNKDIKNDN